MPTTSIISLQETAADNWTAKYRGNFGTYTIKIQLKNGKASKFSCTCPSDGYPCKHIAMITNAINEKSSRQNSKSEANKQADIEKIVRNLPQNELVEFVIEQTKYNTALANAVLLHFTHKTRGKSDSDKYNAIFRKIFDNAAFEPEDYYDYYDDEDGHNLDELDEWFEKAKSHIQSDNFTEAEVIYKAIIEEYAEWASKNQDYAVDYFSADYQTEPFERLIEMVENRQTDADSLFDFCLSEVKKTKYNTAHLSGYFYELMSVAAVSDVNKKKFIELQNNLLAEETDKKSYKAEQILSRIIAFYIQNDDIEAAWKVREENLQVDKFREVVARKKIDENKSAEAKKLIQEFLHTNTFTFNVSSNWKKMLLEIAVKEKDTPEIRRIAKSFLQINFIPYHYNIYKSTFKPQAWQEEVEELILLFQKESHSLFSYKVADLLVEEKKAERLLDYLTRHCSTKSLESYYKHFVKAYPAETLRLFRLSVGDYAKNNLGREHYEYVVRLMKLMQSIAGGSKIVDEMKDNFKSIYKNRRAMMEILEKVK